MTAHSSNSPSVIEIPTDSDNEKELTLRRQSFVTEFKKRLESKLKDYYLESVGDISKAGQSADASKAVVSGFKIIPVIGSPLANAINKGVDLTGETRHKNKAENITGKLERSEKKDTVKIIVGSGVNIFFALEGQLMNINKENYTAGWSAAFTIIIKELVARATDQIFSNKDFILSEKSVSESALNFNYKRAKILTNKRPEFFKTEEFTLQGLVKKVGVVEEDYGTGKRKYFCKKQKHVKQYGYRRLFPGESKDLEGYPKTEEYSSPYDSYSYLMSDESLEEIKKKLLAEILKEGKSIEDKLEDFKGVQEETNKKLHDISKIKERKLLQLTQLPREKPKFEKFLNLPQSLKNFLLSRESCAQICIVFSLDCNVTAERIKDAGGVKVFNWRNFTGEEFNKNTTLAFTHMDNLEEMVNSRVEHQKRIIIVEDKKKEEVLKRKDSLGTGAAFVDDNLAWEDLSNDYQEELLNRNVLVQSKSFLFKELLQLLGISLKEQKVKGQLLIDLINSKTPVLLKDTIPSKLYYYVGRRLRSRRKLISDKLFQDRSKDIFVFSGLERYQLSSLVSEGQGEMGRNFGKCYTTSSATDTSKNQLKKKCLSVRYILLEQLKSDFELLCEKTSEPVHWVHCDKKSSFRWVRSKGCLKRIQKIVEEDNKQDEYYEKRFLEKISTNLISLREQHVCISDTPGMGKSILLGEIGRRISKNKNSLVCFQEVSKFVNAIKENFLQEEVSLAERILDNISSSMGTSGWSESCVKLSLKAGYVQVNLFLDAYDEVHSDDVGACKEILKVLKDLENIRVFITSRPHLLSEIENIFEVVGWNIIPFSEDDQRYFLTSYWKNAGDERESGEISHSELNTFTRDFVTVLNSQWVDKDRAIAGIPLQCFLIAEVFHDDAINSSNPRNSLNSSTPLPELGSLTNLYTKLVEKKVQVYNSKFLRTPDFETVLHWHAGQAFKDLFPEVNYKILIGEDSADEEEMIKIGILEEKKGEGKMSFVHRNFAEYFVAKALADIFTSESQPCSKNSLGSFVENILRLSNPIGFYKMNNCFNFERSEILYHLNSLLEDKPLGSEPLFEINFDQETIVNLSFSLVYAQLVNIFNLFVSWGYFEDEDLFSQKLLFSSVMHSSLDVVELVSEKFCKSNPDLVNLRFDLDNDLPTLLHASVCGGDYDIFDFIMSQGFQEKVKEGKHPYKNLVHISVTNSLIQGGNIEEKIQIINRLLNINKGLLEYTIISRTPLLCEYIHPRIFQLLIYHNASLKVRSSISGETVLHTAVNYLSYEEYFKLVEDLSLKCFLSEMVAPHRNCDKGILQLALAKYDLGRDILELFKDAGANFNSKDCRGYTVLHTALSYRRSLACLQTLVEFGAELVKIDRDQNSAVHLAAGNLDLDVASWLTNIGQDVNSLNVKGNTPLHKVCQLKTCKDDDRLVSVVEMVNFILENGGNVNVANKGKESALHFAAENSGEEIVKLLIDHGANVNGKSGSGSTPLDYAARNRNSTQISKLLLDNKAEPKVNRKGGKELADGWEYIEMLEGSGEYLEMSNNNDEGRRNSRGNKYRCLFPCFRI